MGRQRLTLVLSAVGGTAILALGAGVLPVQAAGTRYVSPFGTDTGDCSTAASPCATVTFAVSKASAGDTINLAAGAYVEQVAITKDLTIVGAGQDDTTIQAPAAPLAVDAQAVPQTYIVAISGTSTVTMSKLTIAGPGPATGGCSPGDPNSLDKGVTVFGGATLNLSSAAVRNVYNGSNLGCQKGDAISVGSPCFSCAADAGHAILAGVKISVYQKNGIAVRGAGATLHMTNSIVTDDPSSQIASNGIEVVNGAVSVVSGTTVTGNECNVTSACGPNPFSQQSASGVLLIQAGAGTSFTKNIVSGNDLGLYTDEGVTLSHNNANNNRFVGIFVDTTAVHGTFTYDTASSTTAGADEYGFITQSGQNNRFAHDTANGNSIDDMDAVNITGTDTNVYRSNACTLASPSKAYWHCA